MPCSACLVLHNQTSLPRANNVSSIQETVNLTVTDHQQPTSTRLATAARGSRLHALALADLDGRLVVDGRGSHTLFDLSGHGQESLLDIGRVLGRGFEEGDAQAVRKLLWAPNQQEMRGSKWERGMAHLCHRVLDDLFVDHVTLVADKQFVDTLGGIAIDLLKPLLHVVEGVHIRDIIDDADSMGASVVGGRDGSKSFLAGCIPLLGSIKSLQGILGAHTI